MRRFSPFRILKVLVLVAVAVTVFTGLTMLLWNRLMPAIFGLRAISFWQALGLLVLGKLLFGGFHRHGRCGARCRGRMEDRWNAMTPEERERFRAGMSRWKGCGPFRRPETDLRPTPPQPATEA